MFPSFRKTPFLPQHLSPSELNIIVLSLFIVGYFYCGFSFDKAKPSELKQVRQKGYVLFPR